MSNLPHSLRLNYSGFIAALIILLAIWALTTTAWAGHGPDSTGLYCSSETEIWQDLYYTQEDIDNGANPDEFHAPYYDCAQNNQACESDGQGNAWCAETPQPPAGQCQQDRDFNEWIACNGAICGEGLFTCEGSDELRSKPHKPCQSYHPDYNPDACGLPPSQCQNGNDFNRLEACNGAECGMGLFSCPGSDQLISKPSDYCSTSPENPACEAPPAQCQQDTDFNQLVACNGAANHCGYGLFACEGSDELRSRFDESGYCGTYPENPACKAPPIPPPEPSIEPPPEVEPPAVLPPARVCENTTCTYTRDGACYQGNCIDLERNCGYDDNCGPVEGCSRPDDRTECPDLVPTQGGTVVATPIISSLTVSASPPIAGNSIPDNTLITVTANMANNTANRFEWTVNDNPLNSTSASFEYRVKYNQTPQLIIKAVAYNNLNVASEPKELSLTVQPPQSSRISATPPQITALKITNNKTGAIINLDGATIESGTELKFEAIVKSNDPTASADCRWYFHNEQSSSSPPPRQEGCSQVVTFTEADSKISLVPVYVYTGIDGQTDREVPGAERIINFAVKPPLPPPAPPDIVQGIADRWGIQVDRSFSEQHLQWIYEFFLQAERTRFMDLARGERIANCGGCIPNQIQGHVQMSQQGKYTDWKEFIPTLTHEMGHGIYWRHSFGASQAGEHFNLYGKWGAVSSYPRARFDVTENYPEVIAGCLHGKGVGTIYQAVWPHYKNFANSLIGQCVI